VASVLLTRRIPASAFSALQEHCTVDLHDAPAALTPGEMKARLAGKQGLLAVVTDRIDADVLDAGTDLKVVANIAVGYDNIDVAAAKARGIVVTNTPDVLTEEVADTALGLLLNTVRELPKAEAWLREGRWVRDGAYPLTGTTLRGRRAGIFGMGRIGLAIARRLEAFGLPIAYHNRSKVEGVSYEYHPTLLGLAAAVDTLVSVAPGTASTEKAVDKEVLEALGPDGVFVNIGRGSTVDEAALATALADGTIRAAGLDVFANEPNVPQALLDAPNASLLPHVGSASVHTRQAMADLVVDNLLAWFGEGKPLTAVPETAHVTAKRG
jgi:lactate dehydrogenase-like 2-hydroxyacid dehydrogenase